MEGFSTGGQGSATGGQGSAVISFPWHDISQGVILPRATLLGRGAPQHATLVPVVLKIRVIEAHGDLQDA